MSHGKKRLGVGFRGAGQVAYEHAKAIGNNPNLYFAAVCSRSEESAQRLAAHYNPAVVLVTMGKKEIRNAIMTFGIIPYPNQRRKRGAKAILGKELKSVMMGMMICLRKRDQVITTATKTPTMAVAEKPINTSIRVVLMCMNQS